MKQGSHARVVDFIHSIYVIDCPDGSYVGCTSHAIDARFREHVSRARGGSLQAIHRAMRAHAPSAFSVRVVAQSPDRVSGIATERAVILQMLDANVQLLNSLTRTEHRPAIARHLHDRLRFDAVHAQTVTVPTEPREARR